MKILPWHANVNGHEKRFCEIESMHKSEIDGVWENLCVTVSQRQSESESDRMGECENDSARMCESWEG